MSDERWECCGTDWGDKLWADGTFKHCPKCGKPRKSPEPAMSEDERMARELIACLPLAPVSQDDALRFLGKARELLCPAAEAKGRREAFEEVRKLSALWKAEELGKLNSSSAGAFEQVRTYAENMVGMIDSRPRRDACGPEKATDEDDSSTVNPNESGEGYMGDGDACAAELDRLRAENAKLAEECDEHREGADQWHDRCKAAKPPAQPTFTEIVEIAGDPPLTVLASCGTPAQPAPVTTALDKVARFSEMRSANSFDAAHYSTMYKAALRDQVAAVEAATAPLKARVAELEDAGRGLADSRRNWMDKAEDAERAIAESAKRIAELESYIRDEDALRADLEAEQNGRMEFRKKHGAREDETFGQFLERVLAERDAKDKRIAELETERSKLRGALEDIRQRRAEAVAERDANAQSARDVNREREEFRSCLQKIFTAAGIGVPDREEGMRRMVDLLQSHAQTARDLAELRRLHVIGRSWTHEEDAEWCRIWASTALHLQNCVEWLKK